MLLSTAAYMSSTTCFHFLFLFRAFSSNISCGTLLDAFICVYDTTVIIVAVRGSDGSIVFSIVTKFFSLST